MYNPFSLGGKKILVTGASSGIGRAVAIECSKIGADVIITARNKERLQETLEKMKGNPSLITSDLSQEESLQSLINELPTLDGVVHCAGISSPLPFNFITREKLENAFNINTFAPMLLTNGILKKKLLQNNSSVVFISSISGVMCSSVGGSIYSGTKGAIHGMVKGIALDLSAKHIRINTICPGMIDTDIFENSGITKEQLESDRKKYPLKRYGKPEEVAYAAIYLLSDASAWVTGSNLLIDGGYTLL